MSKNLYIFIKITCYIDCQIFKIQCNISNILPYKKKD